jgi:hypothetical protein
MNAFKRDKKEEEEGTRISVTNFLHLIPIIYVCKKTCQLWPAVQACSSAHFSKMVTFFFCKGFDVQGLRSLHLIYFLSN